MKQRSILCLLILLVLLGVGCSPADDPDFNVQSILESSVYLQEPEGFHALGENYVGTWLKVSPDYPEDPSNINISVSDPAEVRYKWEATQEEYREALTSIFGEEGDVEVRSLERMELSGREALCCEYTAMLDGNHVHALQYMILTDMAFTITFTDCADGVWLDRFAHSAATIRVLAPGETVMPDTAGLTAYALGQELTIYAEAGLQTAEDLGLDHVEAGLFGQNVTILAMKSPKSDLAGITLDKYREMIWEKLNLPMHKTSPYGNDWCSYSEENESGSFYCFVSVAQTRDAYYTVQMICPKALATTYEDQFSLWMATITE